MLKWIRDRLTGQPYITVTLVMMDGKKQQRTIYGEDMADAMMNAAIYIDRMQKSNPQLYMSIM